MVYSQYKTGLSNPVRKKAAARFLFRGPVPTKKILIKVLALAICFSGIENAWALFGLSATPYEGGSDLRFGRISQDVPELKQELTIRITSDISKRYRVFQELIMPLSNARGQTIPNANLAFYTLSGSNSSGTLAAEQEQPMRGGRILLYTSNSQGPNDSFTLVYGLGLPQGLSGGIYRGRLMFTLETVDGSQTPQRAYVNAAVTLEAAQAGLEVITPVGGKIEVKAKDALQEKNEIIFKIKGSFGQTYRLIQQMPQPLRCAEKELPAQGLLFKITEGKKGVTAGEGELRAGNTVLYTSSLRGEEDTVLVSYTLAEAAQAEAGTYRGKMRYFVEPALPGIKQSALEFIVKIEPTFELQVTPETGGRIEFRDLKPYQPPQVSEIIIDVQTNLGRPYQISQRAESLLTNKEGSAIRQEKFVFYEEGISETGVLKQTSPVPVEVGETTLFVSDEQGSAAKFKIIYELTIPPDLKAGNYSSQITYSISQL